LSISTILLEEKEGNLPGNEHNSCLYTAPASSSSRYGTSGGCKAQYPHAQLDSRRSSKPLHPLVPPSRLLCPQTFLLPPSLPLQSWYSVLVFVHRTSHSDPPHSVHSPHLVLPFHLCLFALQSWRSVVRLSCFHHFSLCPFRVLSGLVLDPFVISLLPCLQLSVLKVLQWPLLLASAKTTLVFILVGKRGIKLDSDSMPQVPTALKTVYYYFSQD
jgi:hypothetical protein